MSTLETMLAEIIDKKKHLDTLREQSPEMAEALALSNEYHGLMAELRAMLDSKQPAYVPYPYPVYPLPSYPPYQTWIKTEITYDTSKPQDNTVLSPGLHLLKFDSSKC